MTKQEFMKQLTLLLADIPDDEKKEALSYYEDYFLDAGVENEDEVLDELDSPEKIAANIKAGLSDTGKSMGEFTENGFTGYSPDNKDELAKRSAAGSKAKQKKSLSAGTIILLILASPVILIIGITVLSALLGVLAGLFGVLIAIIAVVLSIPVVAIALIVAGFAAMLISPAAMFILIGIGLVGLGIGILAVMGLVWIITAVVPPVIRGIVSLIRKLFRLDKKEAAK